MSKSCFKTLIFYQRILKCITVSTQLFSTLIITGNVFCAVNQHIRMVSEGFSETEGMASKSAALLSKE